ncbi:hypothetical protein HPB50_006691 [Hyalomma asiaticum]|uniref:Uncharacterized protein n=1 Tax=Hyalomma asiaticum TaxID=266040 RepID=A0ACB7TG20_HYAAI|nr:hypothetical protein HPB50_006691 [Hyalomma asiaticum]
MANHEYLLTGFGDFWERRHVTFVEPLPDIHVCSFCGCMPSQSRVLPCRHVTCSSCENQLDVSGHCNFDGQEFSLLDSIWMAYELDKLEERRARCLNRSCSFTGSLREVREHLLDCMEELVKCIACHDTFARKDMVKHHELCQRRPLSLGSPQSSVIAKGIAQIKQELGNLASEAANPHDNVAEATKAMVIRLSRFEAVLSSSKEPNCNPGGSSSHCVQLLRRYGRSAGPFRAAAKPGVFVAHCFFHDIQKCHQELDKMLTVSKTSEVIVLAGYSVRLVLKLMNDTDGYISFSFGLCLQDGYWNGVVEWPFAKIVHVILTHPSNEGKDVRAVVPMSSHAVTKKPWPNQQNSVSFAEKFTWEMVEREGFIHDGSLIATLEFE